MNNCLLFVLLKNFNIPSLCFIILSVFFKNIIIRFSCYSQIYEKYYSLKNN